MADRFATAPTYEELRAIADEEWSWELVGELCNKRVEESVHLEFKRGDWLDNPWLDKKQTKKRDRAGILRQQVVAFANSDGGILIVGVAETPKTDDHDRNRADAPDPVRAWRPSNGLKDWAKTSLLPGSVFPALEPFPRIVHLKDAADEKRQGLVVVAERARSPLVSAQHDSKTVFPVRLADSTVDLDAWAAQAILLGTRQRPDLEVVPDRVQVQRSPEQAILVVWVTVHNVGLISLQRPGAAVFSTLQLHNETLVSPVASRDVHAEDGGRVWQHSFRGFPDHLKPFEEQALGVAVTVGTIGSGLRDGEATLALAVFGQNMLPTWWSIHVEWPRVSMASEQSPTAPKPRVSVAVPPVRVQDTRTWA